MAINMFAYRTSVHVVTSTHGAEARNFIGGQGGGEGVGGGQTKGRRPRASVKKWNFFKIWNGAFWCKSD